MRTRLTLAVLLAACAARPELYDRIAATVGIHAIKHSEIERDVRITQFLNGRKLDLSGAERKRSADRLIDQTLIRGEMAKGKYAAPAEAEMEEVFGRLKKLHFAKDAEYRAALAAYGITEAELKQRLAWQLAVLRFIDARFQPAARAMNASSSKPAKGLEERVNEAFFSWLDDARKRARVEYREEFQP